MMGRLEKNYRHLLFVLTVGVCFFVNSLINAAAPTPPAVPQTQSTGLEKAEMVLAGLRAPATVATHLMHLKSNVKHKRLCTMLLNGLRLSNEVLAIVNRPNESNHYNFIWAIHDGSALMWDILNIMAHRDEDKYVQIDKPGEVILYTTVLPLVESLTAFYESYLSSSKTPQDEQMRLRLQAVSSLARTLSMVMSSKEESDIYTVWLCVLIANIAMACYDFSRDLPPPSQEKKDQAAGLRTPQHQIVHNAPWDMPPPVEFVHARSRLRPPILETPVAARSLFSQMTAPILPRRLHF